MPDPYVEAMEPDGPIETLKKTFEELQTSLQRSQQALNILESRIPGYLKPQARRVWVAVTPDMAALVREVGVLTDTFDMSDFLFALNRWLVETRQVNLQNYESEPSEFLQQILGIGSFSYPALLKIIQTQMCIL